MLYLSGAVSIVLDQTLPPMAGWMLQPAKGNHPIGGRPWAADNGCFAAGLSFDADAWLAWLKVRQVYQSTCLFAVAPDVVADAAATLERSTPYLATIRDLGYPAAYVAQDGWDDALPDWSTFDCLFIGGSTVFKLARTADLTEAAHRQGKWVHVGRVNSEKRFRSMASQGVDSVDGTFLAFGPDVNAVRLSAWIVATERQPSLFEEEARETAELAAT